MQVVRYRENMAVNTLTRLRSTNLSTIYVIIALPAMIALSLLISPFGSNDEQDHFLRIVSILNGYSIPEVSYDNDSQRLDKRIAGGYVDAQVLAVAKEVDYGRSGVDPKFKMSLSKIELAMRRYDGGGSVFSEHSNTALYPPLLYTAPIMAIGVAKFFHAPILLWLYLGRIANALVSCGLCWLALKRSTGIAHILLILACLPIFLFQSASLSADALLLPLFLLFSSLLGKAATTSEPNRINDSVLSLTTVVISIGKIAYLPAAALPAFVVWAKTRGYSPRLRNFMLTLLTSLLGWMIWAYIVHDKVFSMKPDVIVDPRQQLQLFLSQPLATIHTFVFTTFSIFPSAIIDSVGRKLGYETVRIPGALCGLLLISVVSAGFVKTESVKYKPVITLSSILISFACFVITVVLLYLQFNEVGAVYISGIQGRYFTPLLVLMCVFLPTLTQLDKDSGYVRFLPVMVGLISAYVTVVIAYMRYWVV